MIYLLTRRSGMRPKSRSRTAGGRAVRQMRGGSSNGRAVPMTDHVMSSAGARDQAIQQIVTILGINGGSPPATVGEFWYQIGLAIKVGIPDDSMVGVAKQVFAKLDEA